jgi:hypothetical protein
MEGGIEVFATGAEQEKAKGFLRTDIKASVKAEQDTAKQEAATAR